MEIFERDSKVILKNVLEFEPKHIFENGQCFRWEKEEDGSYTIVAKSKVINVSKHEDEIILENTNLKEFESIWYEYFDFGRDYVKLRKELSKIDQHLNKAANFGDGLRILKQDAFEMIISFIISANNQIPRIKRSVDLLSERCGEALGEFRGKERFAFPSIEAVANISDEDLAAIKVGFRDSYIKTTANMILNGEVDIDKLIELDYEEAHKELMKLSGVGPKVADCILLFAFSREQAFPVDTWVIKIMNEYYMEEPQKNLKKIKAKGLEVFGNQAGFAQQYLFYYAREHKLGK